MTFQYPEDEIFFAKLLCGGDVSLLNKEYSSLFDFRNPIVKRNEFNKIRGQLFKELIKIYGLSCQLGLHSDCSKIKKFEIDHIIPLSTNELNKKLRKIKAEKGKKVAAQSFGSNNIDNLILACHRCNAYKKHRIIMPKNFEI
jgi:5-methylcytosine-specific restriction endonuclease McrA